jgi:hypothetical protein
MRSDGDMSAEVATHGGTELVHGYVQELLPTARNKQCVTLYD